MQESAPRSEYVHRATEASMCVTCIGRAKKTRTRNEETRERHWLVAFYWAYCGIVSWDRSHRWSKALARSTPPQRSTHLLGVLCGLPVVPAAVGTVLLGLRSASVSTFRSNKATLGYQGGVTYNRRHEWVVRVRVLNQVVQRDEDCTVESARAPASSTQDATPQPQRRPTHVHLGRGFPFFGLEHAHADASTGSARVSSTDSCLLAREAKCQDLDIPPVAVNVGVIQLGLEFDLGKVSYSQHERPSLNSLRAVRSSTAGSASSPEAP
jgi:hypothetical protein